MIFRDAPWMDEELTIFGDSVRKFFEAEMVPHIEEYHKNKQVDRKLWETAGENGILMAGIPEEYGGMGGTMAHESVIFSELGYTGDGSIGLGVHNVAIHYILNCGTEDQKQNWLPRLAMGELIGGIAMTEPGTGSDLQAVRTTAIRDGDDYVLNGAKTFISNGQVGNFFIVVAKTDPKAGGCGISLFGVDTDDLKGFRRGTNLDKLGLPGQDTSELFFDDVRVPASALLGEVEGQGFMHLMKELAWERMIIAILSLGVCDRALKETVEYVTDRKAFGKSVIEFQNTRYKLAEVKTKLEVTRAHVEKCIGKLMTGDLSAAEASMAKLFATEAQDEILDECLQLHGGYGFMKEYIIARMYADSRVQRIYGGTSEIMKELISRSLDA